ncbi:MAG: universal stress protein [Gammaproteobacteria bacterium]|nr:universal stress protein [Gammaproteobacteria bacterium]
MAFKHILVPVDGSEQAFKALDVAATLARQDGATLDLLHVVPRVEVDADLARWAEIEHVRESADWLYDSAVAENILNAAVDRAREHDVKKVEQAVAHGNPAKCILHAARDKKVDAIVMGTRGLSDVQGLIMGSVAHRVCHGAQCTVVTVK